MESPELVEQFRAMHQWKKKHPNQTMTPEEASKIENQYGGGRLVK